MSSWLNRVVKPFVVRIVSFSGCNTKRFNHWSEVLRLKEEAKASGCKIVAFKRTKGYKKLLLFNKDYRGVESG